jgi:hypothetical protein
MRRARNRFALSCLALAVILMTVAPGAFARDDGGQGWYGETNDKTITMAMFIVIAFFPTVILLFSLIQWRLDKRKHGKLIQKKRHEQNADWRGGW